jgi:hypothetical protein
MRRFSYLMILTLWVFAMSDIDVLAQRSELYCEKAESEPECRTCFLSDPYPTEEDHMKYTRCTYKALVMPSYAEPSSGRDAAPTDQPPANANPRQ